jgi:hypothetical protein
MEVLAKLSFLVTSLLLLFVGVRLLWIWRRTREIPELVIGLAYSLGIVGLFLLIAAGTQARAGEDAFGLWLVGHVLVESGQAALVVGVWQIFRRSARWGAVCASACVALCVLNVAHAVWRGEIETYVQVNLHNLLTTGISVGVYLWIMVEALHYSALLRRRRAVGLADTLSVWRFLCWGVGGAAALPTPLLNVFSIVVYQQGLARVPWIFMVVQGFLIISSLGTWLAFFPPHRYKRWVGSFDDTGFAAAG